MGTVIEKERIIDLLNKWKEDSSRALLSQASIYKKAAKIDIISQGNLSLCAQFSVGGSFSSLFLVGIEEKDNSLRSSCSCHSYYGCFHIASVILYILDNPSFIKNFYKMSISLEEQKWLNNLQEEAPVLKNVDGVVAYVLDSVLGHPFELSIGFAAAKQKKNKEFKGSTVKRYTVSQMGEWPESIKRQLVDEDWEIIRLILKDKITSDVDSVFFIKKLIKTGRCFFKEVHPHPLSLGKSRKGSFEWSYDVNRNQSVRFTASSGVLYFVLSTGGIYIDTQEMSCGILDLPASIHTVKSLLKSPVIQPRKASLIQNKLSAILQDVKVKEKPLV